jgi:hypothetical protein
MGNKPIVLKAQKTVEVDVGVVRITPEAQSVVRGLYKRSGLPIRQLVSEIIIQSAGLIEILPMESSED